MMTSPARSWDDYLIPGTDVLRNLSTSEENPYGETSPYRLRKFEERAAGLRLIQLKRTPVVGNFNYDHMKAIHRHIFQDVYEWAGEERTAPIGKMTKAGPDVVNYPVGDPNAPLVAYAYFPAGPQLTQAANAEYDKIRAGGYFRGLNQADFVANLADSWNEINTIHSFREGNTRSQFAFFSQLSEQAGYQIENERFKVGSDLRDEFVAARFYGQATTRSDRLAAVLNKAITPISTMSQPSFSKASPDRPAQQPARRPTYRPSIAIQGAPTQQTRQHGR